MAHRKTLVISGEHIFQFDYATNEIHRTNFRWEPMRGGGKKVVGMEGRIKKLLSAADPKNCENAQQLCHAHIM